MRGPRLLHRVVRELQPGLWHWEALHPDWEGGPHWGQVVSSYAIDDDGRLVLFDPIAPPSEIVERAADREPVVVLTAPWHERDTRSLVERLGAPVFVPPPDTQDDLMRKYGVTAEEATGGSPDVARLLAGDRGEAHVYAAGDRLPVEVEAFRAALESALSSSLIPRHHYLGDRAAPREELHDLPYCVDVDSDAADPVAVRVAAATQTRTLR